MTAISLLRLVLHLFRGLLTCALIFPLVDAPRRETLIRRWSARLLAICGVSCRIEDRSGGAPTRALIVANHISWLDIFVINAMQPCRFVAKADIRDWPLLGWLCAATGTIFISRGNRRDVRRIYEGLVASIHAGERVAFFPEGTTASQGTLLPFHANLFEAAIEAGVPVRPMAVRYLDAQGKLHPAADFTGGTTFVQSIVTILKARQMQAELVLLPALDTQGAHRRELAVAARSIIAEGLGIDEGVTPASAKKLA